MCLICDIYNKNERTIKHQGKNDFSMLGFVAKFDLPI